MIDTKSPAFIAACDAFNNAPQCPELGAEIALAEGIAAYEKALWQPIETAPPRNVWLFYPAIVTGAYGKTRMPYMVRYGRNGDIPRKPTHWREFTPPEEV